MKKIHQRRMLLLLMHFVYLCFSGTKKNEDDAEAEDSCVMVRLLTLRTCKARISIGLGPGLVTVTVHLSGLLVGSA